MPVGENLYGQMRQTMSFFGHNSKKFVWKSKGEALKPENTVPTVKYGGGS